MLCNERGLYEVTCARSVHCCCCKCSAEALPKSAAKGMEQLKAEKEKLYQEVLRVAQEDIEALQEQCESLQAQVEAEGSARKLAEDRCISVEQQLDAEASARKTAEGKVASLQHQLQAERFARNAAEDSLQRLRAEHYENENHRCQLEGHLQTLQRQLVDLTAKVAQPEGQQPHRVIDEASPKTAAGGASPTRGRPGRSGRSPLQHWRATRSGVGAFAPSVFESDSTPSFSGWSSGAPTSKSISALAAQAAAIASGGAGSFASGVALQGQP
mmetsp:Transcript_14058/g.34468  ORF Transcript_14058/g.34468 Transcript_14058/m.34468 type:complete len:271 (+) Transcript_14058:38-850(+)